MARKIEKKICTCCGKELQLKEFYKSASTMYDGKLPICKNCLADRYNTLLTTYEGSSIDAFKHLMMNLDEYFDQELYDTCVMKYGINFIGEYMRLVNGTKERRDKTSLNNNLSTNETRDVALDDGTVVSEDLILRWGRNRKKDDYLLLEKRYKQKLEDYPSDKPAEKAIIRSMCLLELDIEDARVKDKKNVPQLEKALADKFKQLGINPSDNSMYDEQSILMFGTMMGTFENEKPIMDKQDLYKDVDEMNYYWYRNLVVPTMKAWEMADGDYSLDRGIDDIEIKPEVRALMEDQKSGK